MATPACRRQAERRPAAPTLTAFVVGCPVTMRSAAPRAGSAPLRRPRVGAMPAPAAVFLSGRCGGGGPPRALPVGAPTGAYRRVVRAAASGDPPPPSPLPPPHPRRLRPTPPPGAVETPPRAQRSAPWTRQRSSRRPCPTSRRWAPPAGTPIAASVTAAASLIVLCVARRAPSP
ncbi:hypothetical protein BU14_0196s0008 [Porphyra umbilicalis]|uniref:Uncharacterized protein n=1 Tax=Porphyra umbilicalis TaxID=2786 RepID=A0A1X6P612_PORUM|nr:hypothetical protein BU14_0196s0008 [Porphyra umbilicalis]|eukprot:OSX76341.1 hypothetical protein BU14_0196s0008 [Porphyra umbilicalis]